LSRQKIMPFAETFPFIPLLPIADLAIGALALALLAGLVMFFRPLLSGLVRALVLTVRPRRLPKSTPRAA
jgi:hypothetical protein